MKTAMRARLGCLVASVIAAVIAPLACGSLGDGAPNGGPDASDDAGDAGLAADVADTGAIADIGAPDAYTGPIATATRTDTLLNDDWRFNRADVAGAEQSAFDDGAWTAAQLPHTWNAQDGQDGPNTPYYRGVGWYRKHYTLPAALDARRLYLQFDGASMIADVYVNGFHVGGHKGGFAAFRVDVTDAMSRGADNVIAVKVDNSAAVDSSNALIAGSTTADVPPLSADFTFFGGLYRSVHLLTTSSLAIDPMDFGAPGVYFTTSNVSAASADLAIAVKLANAGTAAKNASVRATILDASNAVVQTITGAQSVPAKGGATALLSASVKTPHLWNGLADPYRYSVRVEVLDGADVSDAVTEPLGFRDIRLDPNTGFSLNGVYLDLHGVNKHQDHKDKGWAIADTDTDGDFAILSELGVTAVRLAHYQHAQHTYDVTDKLGIVAWAETPVVNSINATPAFAANAEQQLTELIRQNYNHPSIVFWSVGNETLLKQGPSPDSLIGHLADVVAREDTSRLSAYAANAGNETSPVDWHGSSHGFNDYQGWYGGKVPDFVTWADAIHAAHASSPVGVTEFGAGANIVQHTFDPASKDTGTDHTGAAHTEEYQAYYHEGYWGAMKARPFLFGKFVWNGFDFASDGRSEGNTPGLNDKGLTTYDRQTKKDAFYWYKANWSTSPFVYITSRRFTTLPKSGTTLKVYSNVDSVELTLNGASLGKKTGTNHVFTWTGVTWPAGASVVVATGQGAAGAVSDTVTWTN